MLLRSLRLHKGTSMLALFSVPVALVLLSDNIISFIIPINLENVTGSNFLTGLILAVSSLVGLFSDYLFPALLKNFSWKMQFLFAGIMALFLPIIATLGTIYSSIWIFLIASIFWGIYYELLIFSEEDFMVEEEDKHDYSKDWSILLSMNVVTNVVGPIIATAFILMPIWQYTFILVGFVAVGIIYTLTVFGFELTHVDEDTKLTRKTKRHRFNLELFREMKLWKELLKDMAPILLLTFVLQWLDMTFFVLGGLFGMQLAGNMDMEWIIVVLYNFPPIVIMFFLLKNQIKKRKKLYSTIALLFAGIFFTATSLFEKSGMFVLIPLFLGSFAVSIAWPLNRAAISDITKRAGLYKTNVMGVYNAVGSFACFISPIVMGLVADSFGYYSMTSIMGIAIVIISILLLIIMPRKILVHHQELSEIDSSIKNG